jgi:hypothetical protein
MVGDIDLREVGDARNKMMSVKLDQVRHYYATCLCRAGPVLCVWTLLLPATAQTYPSPDGLYGLFAHRRIGQ